MSPRNAHLSQAPPDRSTALPSKRGGGGRWPAFNRSRRATAARTNP